MTTENNKDEGGNPSYETDPLNVERGHSCSGTESGDFHTTGMENSGVCASTWPLQSMGFGSGKLHFFISLYSEVLSI